MITTLWEEDPRWQEANYRFLVFLVAVLTVGVVIWSAWMQESTIIGYWFLGLGVLFFALCIYAAIVWTVGHMSLWLGRLFKRMVHRRRDV